MLNRYLHFIAEEHLIAERQQVLLAVSGGRDSVAMVRLTALAGIPFAMAHCNFHLRPGDCDADESFVRRLAAECGVPCHVAQFDTVSYAHSHGLSVEAAAREQRYAFFEEVRQREGYDVIATAHHRDDAVETFFINLLRGTGISGLHGIHPKNGNIVRPMLCFSRHDIDDFVQSEHLPFVEDATNAQPLYLRNRIRLQLVPLLRQLQPAFDKVMEGNIARLAEVECFYNAAVDNMRRQLLLPVGDGYRVDIAALRTFQPVATAVFELLRPLGFSSAVAAEVAEALDAQSGKQFFSPRYRLVKDRECLIICPRQPQDERTFVIDRDALDAPLPDGLHIRIEDYHPGTIRLARNEAWFDYDMLRFPLTLRRWQNGDRIVPFGMKGSRLVSDVLSDLKLSRVQKDGLWVLCDSEGILLWIVGIRASAYAPISSSTQKVFKLVFETVLS